MAVKSKHVVANVDEVAPGSCKLVKVGPREIGLFNVGGEFYALANRCPHEGANLCRGRITGLIFADEPGRYRIVRDNEFLRCPWHGWEFDIRTGQSWCDPKDVRIRQFDVTVSAGEELAKGPYVAETFPVTIEQNYVVIEI